MTRTEYARTACLWLTGLALLSLAAIYAQAALWALSAPLGAAAVVCADAALYVQETVRERCTWGAPASWVGPGRTFDTPDGGTVTVTHPITDDDYHVLKVHWHTKYAVGVARPGEELILGDDGEPVCVCTTGQRCLKCRITDREGTYHLVRLALDKTLDDHHRTLPFDVRVDLVDRVVDAVHAPAPAAEGTLGNPQKGTL